MATLIVYDEPQPRQAIRHMLSQSGVQTVIEARGVAEAVRLCEKWKGAIRLIIADEPGADEPDADVPNAADSAWKSGGAEQTTGGFASAVAIESAVPATASLLRWVSAYRELDAAPYLETTSSLLKSIRIRCRSSTSSRPRLDWRILKPFRAASLIRAIETAYRQRSLRRDLLVWVGDPEDPRVPEIRARLVASHAGHWRELATGASLDSLARRLDTSPLTKARLGALLIDPACLNSRDERWLRRLKRSPLGPAVRLACLGCTAAETHRLRALADDFVDPGRDPGTDWTPVLAQLSEATVRHWEIRNLAFRVRDALRADGPARARPELRRLARIGPSQFETRLREAEYLARLNRRESAIEGFLSAQALNPCHPEPYLRLLSLLQDPGRRDRIRAQAVAFCPGIAARGAFAASPGAG